MAEGTGQESTYYCQGYVDEHGQWNNGFLCPKWSSSPTQQYCCGSQYKWYCCTPGESPSTTGVLTTTPRVTTVAVVTSELENIPLVVGVAVGGVVLFIIFLLLCCFLCPCCILSKNRGRKRPPSEGLVIGTVPPYMREEPPPYPAEVMEGLKPLGCGQFQCCQKNCVHHSYRIPEVCPHEEVDPLVHHVGNHQSTPVTNLLPQNYQHLAQGRYARAHSPRPVSPSPGHPTNVQVRHMQIQNRYAM